MPPHQQQPIPLGQTILRRHSTGITPENDKQSGSMIGKTLQGLPESRPLHLTEGECSLSVTQQMDQKKNSATVRGPDVKDFVFKQQGKCWFPPVPIRCKTTDNTTALSSAVSVPMDAPSHVVAVTPVTSTAAKKHPPTIAARSSQCYEPSLLPRRRGSGGDHFYSIPCVDKALLASEMEVAAEQGGRRMTDGVTGEGESSNSGGFSTSAYPGLYTARDPTLLYNEAFLAQGRALVNDLLHCNGVVSGVPQAIRVAGAIVEYWCSAESGGTARTLEVTRTDEKYLNDWAVWGKGVLNEGKPWSPKKQTRDWAPEDDDE